MAIHCAAAGRVGLIKKKRKEKKESPWVKLNAFPANVGPPNYLTSIVEARKYLD